LVARVGRYCDITREPLMSAHEGRHQRRDRQVARLTMPLLMLTIADEVIE
jgi:hypothetical protein